MLLLNKKEFKTITVIEFMTNGDKIIFYKLYEKIRVYYTIYNSKTAGPIFIVFDLLDLSPPGIAE